MNWLTLTPTQIELDLEGTTALALFQSLLDKIEQTPNPGIESQFLGSGEIYRLDGQLYTQAEYRVSAITLAPPMPLVIADIV
jgi:hypothetical protein